MHHSNNLGMIVVKLGGNAMAEGTSATAALLDEIKQLHDGATRVVLVHGGGPEIDRELERRGITSERIEGQRVTTAEILAVTEAVLCGTMNKKLVRECAAHGIRAAGISGQDGGLLIAEKLADLGYVGTITHVNNEVLDAILAKGFIPVVAPLAVSADGNTAYNVNGDTSAGAIAGALRADAFFLITNVDRIRRNPADASTGIDRMSLNEAREFYNSDACQQSMKPKLAAAIHALESGTKTVYICSPSGRTIANALNGNGTLLSR